jgi:hypothetical protein
MVSVRAPEVRIGESVRPWWVPGRRWLLAAGVVAAAQVMVVVVVDGATRTGYQSHRNWVSQLSVGPRGWLGSANLALCGAWLVAYAAGLGSLCVPSWPSLRSVRSVTRCRLCVPSWPSLRSVRSVTRCRLCVPSWPSLRSVRSVTRCRLDRTPVVRWAARLVLLSGAGFAVMAAVPVDPGLGYPPGEPAVHTLTGYAHQAAALALFAAGTAASVLLGRCVPAATWPARVGVASVAVMVLSFAAACVLVTLDVLGVAPGTPSGLLERVALFTGLGWLGVAGLCLLRSGTDRTSTLR